jgi:CRP-like cAMP-binding protein
MENRPVPGTECEIFNGLDSEIMAKIFKIRQIKKYKKADSIFYEGKNPTGVYCIHEGSVKIFKAGKDGSSNILYISNPGDLIGWEQLTEDFYTKNAAALEDSILSCFPIAEFLELIKENSALSLGLAKYLCKGKLILETKIIHLFQGSLRQRLAISLLLLIDKVGMDYKNNLLLRVPISREDMASLIGTNTETAIKLLSQFRKEGIIDFLDKRVLILNLPYLKKICEV